MKTSRIPLWDVLELIANLIASVSHLQELINSETEEQEDKERYEWMLLELVDIRRTIMNTLPKGNKKLRCNVKHAIAQRGYSLEVYYAERNLIWKEISEALAKYMYKVISEYLGIEITSCGRCLNDMLSEDLDSNEDDD